MPSVLVICEFASLNGGERSLLSNIDVLNREDEFQFSVATCPAGPLAESLERRRIAVHPFDTQAEDGRRKDQQSLRNRLQAIIGTVGPGVVHANSLSMSRLVGPVAAQAKVPSIGHLRDIARLSHQAIHDLNCNRRLLAVSEATRDWHVAGGLDLSKTMVLHNGVALERFRPRAPTGYVHRELGLPARARFLVSIGQIGLRKGWDHLLRCAAPVLDELPDLHLLLVGCRFSDKQESVDYEVQLRREAAQNVLGGRVHFLGWRDDIPRLLNEADVLVHPARQEPLGRVLLESAASGVPVVATDVGGTKEIFPNRTSGATLVQVDDSAAMTRAIREVVTSDQLREVMSREGRERARVAFDCERSARFMADHYRGVLR